jgi:hypothetical protein
MRESCLGADAPPRDNKNGNITSLPVFVGCSARVVSTTSKVIENSLRAASITILVDANLIPFPTLSPLASAVSSSRWNARNRNQLTGTMHRIFSFVSFFRLLL